MCYMESKMQEHMEAGLAYMEELERQFTAFSKWWLYTYKDCDASLVDITKLDSQFNLNSSPEVNAMWKGWRAAKGL
jgi:hypothetical protein